jgi:hypothetical protein
MFQHLFNSFIKLFPKPLQGWVVGSIFTLVGISMALWWAKPED